MNPTSDKTATMAKESTEEDRSNLEAVIRDADGFKMNKDGFYLKESDDEEESTQVSKLSKKQRKKIKRQQQKRVANSDDSEFDSDSSTEDVLAFNPTHAGIGAGVKVASGPGTGVLSNEAKVALIK